MYLYLLHCSRNTRYKWKKWSLFFNIALSVDDPRPNSGLFNSRSLNDSVKILLASCGKLFPFSVGAAWTAFRVCSLGLSPCAPPLPKCRRAGPKEEEGCRRRTVPPAPSGWQVLPCLAPHISGSEASAALSPSLSLDAWKVGDEGKGESGGGGGEERWGTQAWDGGPRHVLGCKESAEMCRCPTSGNQS